MIGNSWKNCCSRRWSSRSSLFWPGGKDFFFIWGSMQISCVIVKLNLVEHKSEWSGLATFGKDTTSTCSLFQVEEQPSPPNLTDEEEISLESSDRNWFFLNFPIAGVNQFCFLAQFKLAFTLAEKSSLRFCFCFFLFLSSTHSLGKRPNLNFKDAQPSWLYSSIEIELRREFLVVIYKTFERLWNFFP